VQPPRVVRAAGGHDNEHQPSAPLAPGDSAAARDRTDAGPQVGRRAIDDPRHDSPTPTSRSGRVTEPDNLR
jgi:hypothetical protein